MGGSGGGGRLRSINSRRRSRDELIVAFARQHFESNMIEKGNATLLQRSQKEYFAADVDRSKCLHATSSNALFCTQYVGNMRYHKFSHGDVSYRFNGKNDKVKLE